MKSKTVKPYFLLLLSLSMLLPLVIVEPASGATVTLTQRVKFLELADDSDGATGSDPGELYFGVSGSLQDITDRASYFYGSVTELTSNSQSLQTNYWYNYYLYDFDGCFLVWCTWTPLMQIQVLFYQQSWSGDAVVYAEDYIPTYSEHSVWKDG